MQHIYGVEKYKGEWYVWRFPAHAHPEAMGWVIRRDEGSVRWLCNKATAAAMAGARAMEPDNMIIWED